MTPSLRRRPRLGGEPVLASATTDDGTVLAGTRTALWLGERRVGWEQVEASDWNRDTDTWRVSEVGTWGQPRPVHTFVLAEPGKFLELVRERVTATVVLQRHVPVHGRRGVRVIARRKPVGPAELTWVFEYDEGVDPDDPAVREAATDALRRAQDELGDV